MRQTVDNHEQISIHAPHARSDDILVADILTEFISIHAPHARSDQRLKQAMTDAIHFNPRSSCEERRCGRRAVPEAQNFNPRSSCEERPQVERLRDSM